MPTAASSVCCRTAGRRAGAGAGDQVMAIDSHHPALRMAPAASSRRQCPRDRCTCCCQGPWLSRGRVRLEACFMYTLCAGLSLVTTICVVVTSEWSGARRPAGSAGWSSPAGPGERVAVG
jgi:hypothetical protein